MAFGRRQTMRRVGSRAGTGKIVFLLVSFSMLWPSAYLVAGARHRETLAEPASKALPLKFRFMGGVDSSRSSEPLGGVWLDYPPKMCWAAGALLGGGIELFLSRNFCLEVDGLYLQKGCRIEPPWSELSGPDTVRVDELSFPILLKMRLKPGNSPYLVGGGEFAIVLSRDPKNIDYGLVCGAGYQQLVKGLLVSIEGRYHHGLHDLITDRTRLRKMRVFVLMIGFSL
jgi:hypothetical protein